MRLGVPPTLKQSSLIDSHSLNSNSPISPSVRGKNSLNIINKNPSKNFKEEGHSQCGEDASNNELMTIPSRKQSKRLLSPENGFGVLKRKSMELDDEIGVSQKSFLKRMPLFHQYEQESNLSQIKISQIPKRQLDYQEEFNEDQLKQLTSKLKRKTSSHDMQTVTGSPEVFKKNIKRMNSIDVINEEESSSQGNSLNSSKRIEQKAQMISSLKKGSGGILKQTSKIPKPLEPIQEYNRVQYGITQSSSSQSKTNEQSARLQRKIQQLRMNNTIEVSEVESEKSISNSHKSCQTVNLAQEIKDTQKPKNGTQKNLIQLKLQQIQKSLRLNDEFSMWDASKTEIEKSTNLAKKSSENSKKSGGINDSEKKVLSDINDRFKKIQQISTGRQTTYRKEQPKRQYAQQTQPNKQSQPVPLSAPKPSLSQKSTQTQPSPIMSSQSIPKTQYQKLTRQLQQQYSQKLYELQKQLTKVQKQLQMNEQSLRSSQMVKRKVEEENKFLLEKVKRLERILERNQAELAEWKNFAKEGKLPEQLASNKYEAKEEEWRKKQQQYIASISSLKTQLLQINKSDLQQPSNEPKQITNREPHISNSHHLTKIDQKYQLHIEKIHKYEQNLRKNMQIVKRQQEKIIYEWRLIDQFYVNVNNRNHTNRVYSPRTMPTYQYQTQPVQQPEPTKYLANVSFRADQDQYFKDNDVADISAKVKAMRTQLARDTR